MCIDFSFPSSSCSFLKNCHLSFFRTKDVSGLRPKMRSLYVVKHRFHSICISEVSQVHTSTVLATKKYIWLVGKSHHLSKQPIHLWLAFKHIQTIWKRLIVRYRETGMIVKRKKSTRSLVASPTIRVAPHTPESRGGKLAKDVTSQFFPLVLICLERLQ